MTTFPASPSPGDIFERWRWDGVKWLPSGIVNLPSWAIHDAPADTLYGRTLGAWRAVLPQVSPGPNRLQIGNILFQWGYLPATAGADDWVHFPQAYAAMPTIQLTALHGGGGVSPNQLITAGIDHEGPTAFAYRMRFSQGGAVNIATQGFMWLAVGRVS